MIEEARVRRRLRLPISLVICVVLLVVLAGGMIWMDRNHWHWYATDPERLKALEGLLSDPKTQLQAVRDQQIVQQQVSNDRLVSGEISATRWRVERQLRHPYWLGARDQVYAATESPKERDAVDRYYRIIEEAAGADGIVDWDKVDVGMSRMTPNDLALIEEFTGLGGTETEKQYREDMARVAESGYWDIRDNSAKEYARRAGFPGITDEDGLTRHIEGMVEERWPADRDRSLPSNKAIFDKKVEDVMRNFYEFNSKKVLQFQRQPENRDIIELTNKWGMNPLNQKEIALLAEVGR